MARVSPAKMPGSSRVRFIMLDADLSNGDLTQITQAIQNALRPPASPQHRITTATPSAVAANATVNGGSEAAAIEPDSSVVDDDPGSEETAELMASPAKPRRFRTPKVLDIDLQSEPAFKSFAEQKNPTSDQKRYLVAAAWLKLHRSIDPITADHVYTCFRGIKWPTAIADFSQPLRKLKRRQLLDGAGKGQFTINHLGLADVGD